MSYKSNGTGSFRSGAGSFRQDMSNGPGVHLKVTRTPSGEERVILAGDESKDRIYEPKTDPKTIRILTVVVYVFSVSLAAIILSLYYVFFWVPKDTHYLDSHSRVEQRYRSEVKTARPFCLSASTEPSNLAVKETTQHTKEINILIASSQDQPVNEILFYKDGKTVTSSTDNYLEASINNHMYTTEVFHENSITDAHPKLNNKAEYDTSPSPSIKVLDKNENNSTSILLRKIMSFRDKKELDNV